MKLEITILGCGTSSGVPIVGLGWGRCDPEEPKNRRRRCSVLVRSPHETLLIDTSPDCREQLLEARVQHLSAVLYTHDHADHTHGLDDLRWLNIAMRRPIPCYGDNTCLTSLQQRFAYAFKPISGGFYYKPVLEPHTITGPFRVGELLITPFEQGHGASTTLGFRIGDFAYSTDTNYLSDQALETLSGTKLWVVDCLRYKVHSTHAHLDQTLEWVAKVQPDLAVTTHMNADMDYHELSGRLPDNVIVGYDGLCLKA